MANELTKVTDQNGVDHPFKDVAAFPRSEQAVLSAKNVHKYPYIRGNNYTQNNLTFAVVTEGVDKGAIDLSTNGTISGNVDYVTHSRNLADGDYYLPIGDYIYSIGEGVSGIQIFIGCTSNGSYIDIARATKGVGELAFSITADTQADYKLSDGSVLVSPHIGADANITVNKRIYPMIRLATDPDPTFAPPAMTNQELTEKVQGIINAASNAADFAAFKSAIGNL